jgi:hypothetical protein
MKAPDDPDVVLLEKLEALRRLQPVRVRVLELIVDAMIRETLEARAKMPPEQTAGRQKAR